MRGVEITEDSIHIHDEEGEIVMWTMSEWEEDPEVALSIFNAIDIFHRQGPSALRERINKPRRFQIGMRVRVVRDITGEDLGYEEYGVMIEKGTVGVFMQDPFGADGEYMVRFSVVGGYVDWSFDYDELIEPVPADDDHDICPDCQHYLRNCTCPAADPIEEV